MPLTIIPFFPRRHEEVCLLPGPVALSAAVHMALQRPALYHREPEFVTLFENVRARLGSLAGGRDASLFVGSGTSSKALGSCGGIALVFADVRDLHALDTNRVPGYLDLAATLACEGPRYTFPSGPLFALADGPPEPPMGSGSK